MIGLYFMIIFLSAYILLPNKICIKEYNIRVSPSILNIIFMFSIILSMYVIFVHFYNMAMICNSFGQRALQSTTNIYLENIFKIKPVFIILILNVSFLVLIKKKFYYFILLIPFLLNNILMSAREYIFFIFVSWFILWVFLERKVNIIYVSLCILLVGSLVVFRLPGEFSLMNLIQIFYEFIFTFSVAHLTYESFNIQDFLYTLNYSMMRIFPSSVYQTIFGEYHSYMSWASESNPLGWGLAGNIIAEAISFKQEFLIVIYPFIIVLYGKLINFLIRTQTLSGKIIFLLALIFLQSMFRGSFLDIAFYPFYVFIFFGLWIFAIDVVYFQKRRKYI